MQTSKLSRVFEGKGAPFFATLIGAFCFMLSLVMALLMFQSQRNPGFLIIWLVATVAMTAFARFNRQWRDTLERIYVMNPSKTVLAARKNWRWDVEDVTFRDLSPEPVSFRK